MLQLYQKYLSPFLHYFTNLLFGNQHGCRYSPTCSEYTRQAVAKYGIIAGGNLAVRRVISCHPYSKRSHIDPVP